MSDYPEKTCDLDRLVRMPKAKKAMLAGAKTQQRRAGVYGYPGETFDIDGVPFIMTDLKQKTLGEMTETDWQGEGYESYDAYKNFILRMHPGMTWDNTALAWVHYFKRQSVA